MEKNVGMMKKIGIYICNYNKKEYVVKCVESLLNQMLDSIDICVVDNASEDGSIEALEKTFGRKISIIRNSQNLGGSGGFNIGLRDAIRRNYKYVVLVDNDVWVDKNAIQIMYDYMEKHEDVGILGPEILRMDRPEIVQDLGGCINERYNMQGNYSGETDKNLPAELECAYISTCTAMARIEVVKKIGLMPEENFIYWDDVEWSRKCQLHGYRTVAVSSAKVWHNHSITSGSKTSFVRYYLTRNRLHFFAKYLDIGERGIFCEKILEEIHTIIFMYAYEGLFDLARTVVNAWEDFLAGRYGKAVEGRILQQAASIEIFDSIITKKEKIYIIWDGEKKGEDESLKRVIDRIDQLGFKNKVSAVDEKEDGLFCPRDCQNAAVMRLCDHVKEQKINILPDIYVDKYCHCITTETDYEFLQNYEDSYKEFKEKYADDLAERMKLKRKYYE